MESPIHVENADEHISDLRSAPSQRVVDGNKYRSTRVRRFRGKVVTPGVITRLGREVDREKDDLKKFPTAPTVEEKNPPTPASRVDALRLFFTSSKLGSWSISALPQPNCEI